MNKMNESTFNNTANETSFSLDSSFEINVTYAVAISIVCILTIVGNLGTINAFRKLPELLDKPSEMLILSLSCSDLVIGLICIPFVATPLWFTTGTWPFGETACRAITFCADVFCISSLYTICAIFLDRFLLVYLEYPQYLKVQTKRRIYLYIAFVWLWPTAWAVVELSLWDVFKKIDETASLDDYSKICISPSRRIEAFVGPVFVQCYLTDNVSEWTRYGLLLPIA